MKDRLVIAIIIVGIVICPVIVCVGIYLAEWVNHEIALQKWLDGDLRRVDFFGIEASVGKDQLREALLIGLPPGTSEEQVEAFYRANRHKNSGGWVPTKYSDDENYVLLEIYAGTRSHGHFLQRMLSGRIRVIFHLNPIDNSLTDITVHRWGFEF